MLTYVKRDVSLFDMITLNSKRNKKIHRNYFITMPCLKKGASESMIKNQ